MFFVLCLVSEAPTSAQESAIIMPADICFFSGSAIDYSGYGNLVPYAVTTSKCTETGNDFAKWSIQSTSKLPRCNEYSNFVILNEMSDNNKTCF